MIIIIKDALIAEIEMLVPEEMNVKQYGKDVVYLPCIYYMASDIEEMVVGLRRSGWCVEVRV